MYVTVLESLDLQPGQSFLNIGSGSGYLSCLASYILGEGGICHGIEISKAAVNHSRACSKAWLQQIQEKALQHGASHSKVRSLPSEESISFVHGNCFDIDVMHTIMNCKYDRIYVGAGCPERRKEFFFSMLADNGVLVVPINERNQMMKVKRYMGRIFSVAVISSVHFAPLIETAVRPYQSTIITAEPPRNHRSEISISFDEASTVAVYHSHSSPSPSPPSSRTLAAQNSVKLPPVLWAPVRSRHRQFPVEFRQAVFFILLATRRYDDKKSSLFGTIPFYIWMHVLSYANR